MMTSLGQTMNKLQCGGDTKLQQLPIKISSGSGSNSSSCVLGKKYIYQPSERWKHNKSKNLQSSRSPNRTNNNVDVVAKHNYVVTMSKKNTTIKYAQEFYMKIQRIRIVHNVQ